MTGYTAWIRGARPVPRAVDSSWTIPADQIPLLRMDDARRLFEDPKTIFVDVRSTIDYAYGRIRGAVSMPEEEFEARFDELKPRLEKAKTIVVYCKSADCGKSLWVAIRLRNSGFGHVAIYPNGWNEWVLHGNPVDADAVR
jgi:rhodanese-related sulfurtransferase